MGLSDGFSHVRGQILAMVPIPKIAKVFSLVLQDEKHREISAKTGPTLEAQIAFAVKAYQTKNNPKPSSTKKDRPLCTNYGILGHTIDKCYKLHGYPLGYGKNKSSSNCSTSVNHTAVAVSSSQNSDFTPN